LEKRKSEMGGLDHFAKDSGVEGITLEVDRKK